MHHPTNEKFSLSLAKQQNHLLWENAVDFFKVNYSYLTKKQSFW